MLIGMPRPEESRKRAKEKKRAAAMEVFAKSLKDFQVSVMKMVDKKLQGFVQEHMTPVQQRLDHLEMEMSNMVPNTL